MLAEIPDIPYTEMLSGIHSGILNVTGIGDTYAIFDAVLNMTLDQHDRKHEVVLSQLQLDVSEIGLLRFAVSILRGKALKKSRIFC